MPQTLNIDNFGAINLLEPTVLDADAAAGATTITLVNNDDYVSGKSVVIGNPGSVGSEVTTSGSPSGATQLAVSALILGHNRGEPVNMLFGNQIKVYRAANVDGTLPADGSFASIATVTIDVNEQQTAYTDANGSSAYWYKFSYYNGTTETSLADSTAQRGGGYGHYESVANIRREASLTGNLNIPDAVIDSMRIEAEEEVDGELFNVYTLPFAQPIPAKVRQAVRQIAAGEMLLREYGPMANGSKKMGDDLAKRGREILERIKSREIILLDTNYNSLLLQPMVTSWPNATTDQSGTNLSDADLAANDQDRGPKVRSSQVF